MADKHVSTTRHPHLRVAIVHRGGRSRNGSGRYELRCKSTDGTSVRSYVGSVQ
jgi:hypothetical protein